MCPFGGQVGPIQAKFADPARHAENLFLDLGGSLSKAMLPTSGRPAFGARCPYTGPRCVCQAQLPSKRAQVAPCWTPPSWASQLKPSGPSSVQVTPKSDPSRLLVGPSRPASFLSVLICPIPWARAVLVAKRLEYHQEGSINMYNSTV